MKTAAEKTFRFVAENGVPFLARLVQTGDRYGLDDCLVHDKPEAMVEFYDLRSMHTPRGQFVSRYYWSNFMHAAARGRGLLLHGGEPSWSIGALDVTATFQALDVRGY
jgi:hypothetical protein